jgi:hypothetical protein
MSNEIRTPDDVLHDIRQTRTDLLRGSNALRDAEIAAQRADLAADLEFDAAFMVATGTLDERKAHARDLSQQERDRAFIAIAEHNRVKAKLRHLESALVSLQAELKWMKDEGA